MGKLTDGICHKMLQVATRLLGDILVLMEAQEAFLRLGRVFEPLHWAFTMQWAFIFNNAN